MPYLTQDLHSPVSFSRMLLFGFSVKYYILVFFPVEDKQITVA